jgi:hypothetical protein
MKQLYLLFVLLYPFSSFAQKKDCLGNIPRHYLSQVDEKAKDYRQLVDQQSIKLLDRLQKLETRMKRKLAKKHPAMADSIFLKTDNVVAFNNKN